MLARSQDASHHNEREIKMRLMFWRALSIRSYLHRRGMARQAAAIVPMGHGRNVRVAQGGK